MRNDLTSKLELIIGIALLLISVIGFLFLMVVSLPKDSVAKSQAQVLETIPRDFFSADNELVKQIKQLSVPAGVPVTVDGGNLGRGNVFEKY